jgi:Cu/Ag efflux protein CusF
MTSLAIVLWLLAADQTGQLHGTIVARDHGANTITVSHGEVPGIMGAMTMTYEVRGAEVHALPPDGTPITATLHQAGGALWLTDVMASSAHAGTDAGALLMRQASGTSMNPEAAAMHMSMMHRGDWMLMLHGNAFVNAVEQSGPRGRDKVFSTNWIMGMADRPLGGGHLMLRTMLSLEPLTVGDTYPELFQTGETLHGRPIVDAQHPHDFFMELAAEYAHPLAGDAIGYVYAAPVGDPALGPVAYPHRASAAELPQAPLSHHLQDSTHIAASVITLGVQNGRLGYAFSGFHGREPDENRWDIDRGAIDSWSARVTYDPAPRWSMQLSTGHLKHPEALEDHDAQRTTASVSFSDARWDTSVIYGRSENRNSFTAESVLKLGANLLTGRAEHVDKGFTVNALTLGYTRELAEVWHVRAGVGGNVTLYDTPSPLEAAYGRHPHALYVYLRLRGGM